MKLTTVLTSIIALAGMFAAGCHSTLDGRTRAGMPFVKDQVGALYERSPMEIWAAAKDVINFNGTLGHEDTLTGTLEGSVNERRVWVKVEAVDTKVTRVTVQARTKGGFTDVELAGELDKQIAIRLASGNLTPFAPIPSSTSTHSP